MEPNKTVRKPRQSRSIHTKEKILDAAYRLFCEKGYYKTTTNEIAKVAGVSIGSLYSYFTDKDTILLEIMGRYNDSFMQVHERLRLEVEQYRNDPKSWLRRFMLGMVEAHRLSKELNLELQQLRHSMPEVAAIMGRQHEKISQLTFSYVSALHDMMRVHDLEAAAIVVNRIISSVVDQIVFCDNPIDDERILEEGVDAVYRYLIG